MKCLTFVGIFLFMMICSPIHLSKIPEASFTKEIYAFGINQHENLKLVDKKVNESLTSKLERKLGIKGKKRVKMRKKVKAYAYNATKQQCDKNPDINANGKKPRVGDIAISKDLEKSGVKMGTKVYIPELDRIFQVNDRMKQETKGQKVDILHRNYRDAKEFGVQNITLVWIEWKGENYDTQGF